MNNRLFHIERFYYGKPVQEGRPADRPTVLAASAGIGEAQVREAMSLARITPPPAALVSEQFPASIGFFRSRSERYFIFLKAQRTDQGQPQLAYFFIPAAVLRSLEGNALPLLNLAYEPMPTFSQAQQIPPLALEGVQSLSPEAQVEFLYDLFYYSGDKVQNVQALVASLVHGVSLAVLNAPPNLKQRLGFVQGLLSMLPTTTRLGLTWASYVDDPDNTLAQIKFMGNTAPPREHSIYDWASGTLLTPPIEDRYSKFIASQLRLDASLVLETLDHITRTATWRVMKEDSLPEALYLAARRAAVDSAVQNNQPVERELVASILRQDPTLTDELRVMYAWHLLAFTLVMQDEPQHADVLPVVAAANRSVADAIYELLDEAVETDRAPQVMSLIERWLRYIPQASSLPWYQLAQQAALSQLRYLLESGLLAEAATFISNLARFDSRVRFRDIAGEVVKLALPYSGQEPNLALAIFLYGAQELLPAAFRQMMATPQLVGQLPPRVRQALAYLQPAPRPDPPRGLLVAAATGLPTTLGHVVVARLAEWAVRLERIELLDSHTIDVILRAIRSGRAERFEALVQHLIGEFTRPERIRSLDQAGLEVLPQLYFATQLHKNGVRVLENYQFSLYGLERIPAFTDFIGKVFLNLRLPAEEIDAISAHLEESQLRVEPRIRAYCAALIAADWDQRHYAVAHRLTDLLYADSRMVKVIRLENTFRLLEFHVRQGNSNAAVRTASVITDVALLSGERGVDVIAKMYELLAEDAENATHGLELLRRFTRRSRREIAAELPGYLGDLFGEKIRKALQVTYLLRILMGDDDLNGLNVTMRIVAGFLIDVAIPYHTTKEIPPIHRLRQDMDSMHGNLTEAEKAQLASDLEMIARFAYAVGRPRASASPNSSIAQEMRKNILVPRCAWDMIAFMGGHFSDHQHLPLELERQEASHIIGYRSAVMLKEETPVIVRFLRNLLTAFPPDKPPRLDLDALLDELDSLWNHLSLYVEKDVINEVAYNAQFIAQVLQVLSTGVKERAFKSRGLKAGDQKPQNSIEALLWMSGYCERLLETR